MTTLSDSLSNLFPTAAAAVVRRAPSIDWKLLDEVLESAGRENQSASLRRVAALQLIGRVLSADYVAWLDRDAQGQWVCAQEGTADTVPMEGLRQVVLFTAKEINGALRSVSRQLDESRQVVVNHIPLPNGSETLLAAVIDNTLQPSLVTAVQRLIGLDLLSALPSEDTANVSADSWMSAAVLGLSVRLAAAADAESGAKIFADLVCQHLKVERLAVARVTANGSKAKLTALSDVERPDYHSDAAKLIEECLTETISQPRLTNWSSQNESAASGLAAWPRLAESWKASELTALHLLDRDNHLVAICLVAGNRELSADENCFLSLAGQVAGPLLKVLERGTVRQWWTALRNRLPKWVNRWAILAAVTIVGVPLSYPWPARTACTVQLEPCVHRLIAAPFEGIFEQNLVLPGDQVQAGQILGRMDGREVRTRLAATEAELARASKSRDSNLAAGKLAEAQIDKLQTDRYLHEREVLTRRLKQVEISSPLAGIVVSGDLKRHEGATVKVGQSLYEVAPLEKLIAEIAIPEEELELVENGANITLRLDAFPGKHWEGQIERIHPRAEPRENRQVFIAETMLTNTERHDLRPGMKGSAKVTGPRMSGLELVTRKPLITVRRFLGW